MPSYPPLDRRFLLSGVAAAAVAVVAFPIVLQPILSYLSPSKLISEHEKVATLVENGDEILKETSVEKDHEYDVIIVGGGTAGCVLASRLTEDPRIRVLVLEAGESAVPLIQSRIPIGHGYLMRSKYDWNLTTVPQIQAHGRARYWPRAKMLGGCSSINSMMFHYGAPSDYDEWATIGGEGASEWSYKNFQKYFLKFETYVPSKLYPLVDPSLRGSTGPVKVGYFGNFSRFASNFLEACQKVGIRLSHDINTYQGTLGATRIMTYIDSWGRRVTTETAYLTPDVLKRRNLTVTVHANVTRILFDTSAIDTPRAIGVEFSRGNNGPRFRARARREVIVSAGAVHTPQILMLSGVGPASELAQHGIPIISDLPVGKHLMDHTVVNVRFRVNPGESLNPLQKVSLTTAVPILKSCVHFFLLGKGPLTCNIGESVAFLRSTDPALFPSSKFPGEIEDSTSGPQAPDLEVFASPLAWKDHGFAVLSKGGHLASINAVLLRPTSLGTITLKSASPFDAPIIDPKYLDTQHDLDVLVRGVKLIFRIMQQSPIASLLDNKTQPNPVLDNTLYERDDAELVEIVRERVETLYHPTSTARMAPLTEGGVVDPQLRVHGIPNLRIVDASIFPTIIAGHTTAPVIAVAERAADLIKESLSSKV